jgi:hypothetical protein
LAGRRRACTMGQANPIKPIALVVEDAVSAN